MVHPAIVIPLLLVKKIGIYYAAKSYGFPRLYRRLLEGAKHMELEEQKLKVVKSTIKDAFRDPMKLLRIGERPEMTEFARKLSAQSKATSDEASKILQEVVKGVSGVSKSFSAMFGNWR